MSSKKLNIPDIHIGNIIMDYLKAVDRPQAFLAKSLNMASTNISKLLRKKSIETDKLFGISLALEHNFFALYGNDPDLIEGNYTITLPELGVNIEKRMKELKMTQMEFSTAIGIARSDVNRILRKTSFETDKLIAISEALDYNFFKDFYGPVAVSEEKQLEQLNTSTLKRYEELVIENDRLKQRVFQLENENRQLKDTISKMQSQ
jgi:predicted XRE-type DNA-binding protein